MVDATIVKVTGTAGRKRGTQSQAIGKSKGGMTTKILALTDAWAIWCALSCCGIASTPWESNPDRGGQFGGLIAIKL